MIWPKSYVHQIVVYVERYDLFFLRKISLTYYYEKCSSLNKKSSLPIEMTKVLMRELTHDAWLKSRTFDRWHELTHAPLAGGVS